MGSRWTRTDALVHGLVALLGFIVAIGAVPAVLVLLAGLPVPRPFTAQTVLSARGIIDLLALVTWAAWFVELAKLAAAVTTRVHSGDLAVHGDVRLVDRLAVRVATALMTIGIGATIGTGVASLAGASMPPAAVALPQPVTTPMSAATSGSSAAPAPTEPTVASPAAATQATYTVAPGDTLWSIAARLYGDGSEWSAIATANYSRTMVDGTVFLDPSLIRPGWVLALPDDLPLAVPPAAPPAPPPVPATAPISAVAPTSAVAPPTAAPSAGTPAAHTGTASAAKRPARAAKTTRRAPSPRSSRDGRAAPDIPPLLPELVVLGVGSLVACAVARRVRAARRMSQAGRQPDDGVVRLSPEASDMAALIAPFADMAAMDVLELGLCHLTAAVGNRQDEVPPIRLVRVGADGLSLFLAEPARWAPGSFTLSEDAMTWHLAAATDLSALPGGDGDEETWLPALVPVGSDVLGTYLVPAEPGTALAVTGERSAEVLRVTTLVTQSWPWREQVAVVTEPAQAATEAALLGDPTRTSSRRRVVYFGRRSDLTATTAARVAVVHDGETDDNDVEVVAGPEDSMLPADGLTVSGVGLVSGTAMALDDLLASVEGSLPPRRPGPVDLPATLGPGPVEIKMLAAIPRVEGWAVPPPPNRERQIVRLLSYLAMADRPVGIDRLRSRALGADEDSPAARKTVHNVAGEIRTAIGPELLAPADADGRYATSPLVTVDALRLCALVAAGSAATTDAESVELLTTALRLVEDVPLADVRSGYSWWQDDGYAGETERAVIAAACQLVPKALAAQDAALARWAVGRARIVAPYAETLYALAIEIGGATGDRRKAADIYAQCCEMLEGLLPGSVPTDATERVYWRAMGDQDRRAS